MHRPASFTCAALALLLGSALAPQQRTLVISHVTVIDVTGRAPERTATVTIRAGRIAAIDQRNETAAQPDGEVLDGSGKYLIPGLWDMHVHVGTYAAGRTLLPSLLRRGVTGVRDMASAPDDILRLRDEAEQGADLPHLYVAGPILQGTLPFHAPMILSVPDASAAIAAVDGLHARGRGVDFVKVGDTMSRDAYVAVAARTRSLGIPFAGHLPVSIGAAEASDAGQRTIEHFGSAHFHGLLIACSSDEAAMRVRMEDVLSKAFTENPDAKVFSAALVDHLLDTYDPAKCDRLFSRFARRGTWQTPTLVAIDDVWAAQRQLSAADRVAGEQLRARYRDMIRGMSRAHVGVLAGTDLPLVAGRARLHDELAALVEAGLSPREALQAATQNAAQAMGRGAAGTIARGQQADLVLLDANPLADIHNTARTSAVVLDGRVVYRAR